jgi:hypothetical protein
MEQELTKRQQLLLTKAKVLPEYVEAYLSQTLPDNVCMKAIYTYVLDNNVTNDEIDYLYKHMDFITVFTLRQALNAIHEYGR